jgi:hypothetical protein
MRGQVAGKSVRMIDVVALLIGLVIGLVLAVRPSAGADIAPPADDAIARVGDFTPEVVVPIDHTGHYTWESPELSSAEALEADSYVVEPRFVNATIEDTQMYPVETAGGIKLVYEFNVIEFSKGARVIILDAHADSSVEGA